MWIGIAAVVAVVTAFVVAVAIGRDDGRAAEATGAVAAPSGSAAAPAAVSIPVAEVDDGKAHFFTYDAGGTAVRYMVVEAGDKSLRVAFDACDVCYPNKKGYSEAPGAVRCNNCGRVFRNDDIAVKRGGCNPSPIDGTTVTGGQLTIPVPALEAGARFF